MGSPLPSAFLPPPSLKLRKAEKKNYYIFKKGEDTKREQKNEKKAQHTKEKCARKTRLTTKTSYAIGPHDPHTARSRVPSKSRDGTGERSPGLASPRKTFALAR